MKNTTKTIAAVLAVLLVATLFVGAASAQRTVYEGQDAFVFETIAINGTVPDVKLASSTLLANKTMTSTGAYQDYANPAGENLTATTLKGTGYYAFLYESTSTDKTAVNLAGPGSFPVYINNSTTASTPAAVEYGGPTETITYTADAVTKDVNLMKLAKYDEGYNASNASLITNFTYIVDGSSGAFMGATSSGANVQYFKNFTAGTEVTLQPDNTFTAVVGSTPVQVYVNVTKNQAADIGAADWATLPVMQINGVVTPGTTMQIVVAPLYNYTAAAKTAVEFPVKLTKYSEGSNPTAVNQISSNNQGYFYLTKDVVNGQYGAYYFNGTSGTSGNKDFIYIWYPELSLQAELSDENGVTSGDSIDGKTVNKDTEVAFLINAPKVAPAYQVAYTKNQIAAPAFAKIVFTTPAAGKTTEFGTGGYAMDFGNEELKQAQTNVGHTQAGNDATAGTWTAQAEYVTQPFKDYAEKSNTISFTLQSSTLTITASKDSVVRSNPFTVTISGKSQTEYGVYIESPATNEVNPTLQDAQNGFQSTANYGEVATGYKVTNGAIRYNGYSAAAIGGIFKTDASGKRTIQFNTDKTTEDKTYTIKASGLTTDNDGDVIFNTADYDKVKVKVEKGSVTIAASGDGSYYIGDEIKLTGTNTDSTEVFLFITGQNLAENGIQVKALPDKKSAKDNSQPVAVKTDNTWEYKWDTSKIALDTGAYTIYATSRLTNGKSSEAGIIVNADAYQYGTLIDRNIYAVKLSDSEYATVSINLKQPFLSAVPSGTIVAKGDKIYIRGTAEGDPSSLNIFIFGPNFFEPYSVSVEDDGTYEKKIEIPTTMSSNQYFVVVQHPMYNDYFDAQLVNVDNPGETFTSTTSDQWAFQTVNVTTGGDKQSFVVWGTANKLQGSQAADALTKMIDSANIDDIYTKLTFTVAEPWIKITNPGDKAVGSKFTITGTTNLAVDDQILVEVMSSSFSAVDKTSTSTTSGVSQATKVVAGEGTDNTWSVEVDTTNWKLDEYTIKVNGIEVDVTTTTNFNVVDKVVTTTPTTAVPTGATPTATTAKPTETPKTPGFGAFIALAGLGAVALLVLRRN